MHDCRSLRGFAALRAKLICGFAASRAELRLAALPPPVRNIASRLCRLPCGTSPRGFAASRAESLWLSVKPSTLWRLRRPRRSLKKLQTNYRKARGFPHGRRQSRDEKPSPFKVANRKNKLSGEAAKPRHQAAPFQSGEINLVMELRFPDRS